MQRHSSTASTWQKQGTVFEIRSLSGLVTLDRIVGVIDDEAAQTIAAAHDEIFARGNRPHTFHDWSQVVGYSPFARKFLTGWLGDQRGRLRSAHILFSSGVLAMGISVANAVLGGFIAAYGDPETFRAAMEKALRDG